MFSPNLAFAACGCIFSMIIELIYHRWSPEYRQQDPIEDALHLIPHNWDAGRPESDDERQQRATRYLRERGGKELEKIAKHRRDHAGPTWPYSTHKNLHGAAVNGILAGLIGQVQGAVSDRCGKVGESSVILYSREMGTLLGCFAHGACPCSVLQHKKPSLQECDTEVLSKNTTVHEIAPPPKTAGAQQKP